MNRTQGFSLVECFPWLVGIAVLTLALLAFAGITPPGVTDPKVARTKAHVDAHTAFVVERAACEATPQSHSSLVACIDVAAANRIAANVAADKAYRAAKPAWEAAVAKAKAEYKAEADRCKTLPKGERKACEGANDNKYGAGAR